MDDKRAYPPVLDTYPSMRRPAIGVSCNLNPRLGSDRTIDARPRSTAVSPRGERLSGEASAPSEGRKQTHRGSEHRRRPMGKRPGYRFTRKQHSRKGAFGLLLFVQSRSQKPFAARVRLVGSPPRPKCRSAWSRSRHSVLMAAAPGALSGPPNRCLLAPYIKRCHPERACRSGAFRPRARNRP